MLPLHPAHPRRRRGHRRPGRGPGAAPGRLPARRGREAARRRPCPGAGIFLPGNAARALRDLGLDDPVRPLGRRRSTPAALPRRARPRALRGRPRPSSGPASASAGRCPAPTCSGCCSPASAARSGTTPRVGAASTCTGGAADVAVRRRHRVRRTTWSSAPTGDARRSAPWPRSAGRPARSGRSSTAAWSPAARRSPTGRRCSAGAPAFVVMPMGGGRLYLYADETGTERTRPTRWPGSARSSATTAARCRPCSTRWRRCRSRSPTRSCSGRWSRGPGRCWSATPRTPPRRRCPQGAAMALGGRRGAGRGAARAGDGGRRRSRRTKAAAARVPDGSGTAPATVTAPATCPRRCATRCCADGASGSFGEHYRLLVDPAVRRRVVVWSPRAAPWPVEGLFSCGYACRSPACAERDNENRRPLVTTVAPKPIVTRPWPVRQPVKGSALARLLRTTDAKQIGIMYMVTRVRVLHDRRLHGAAHARRAGPAGACSSCRPSSTTSCSPCTARSCCCSSRRRSCSRSRTSSCRCRSARPTCRSRG